MPVVALIACLAAVVGGSILARPASLVAGCGLLIAIGYVVGHEFWHAKVGPIPVTIDRFLLASLLAASAVQWRLGRFTLKRAVGPD